MKLWKYACMVMSLGIIAPSSVNADAELLHISPKLAFAQPCGAGSGCAFSWTLATRYGMALEFAEQRYGRRDLNWTLLGVDFAQIDAPQIFYAGIYDGRKDIVVQLTANSARNERRALFQLGHEVIHTLSPIGPDARSSVLEEGIATYNSLDFVRASGFEMSAAYINVESYADAYWAIIELEAKQPDFQARTVALRQRYGSLSGLSATQVQAAYPSIDPGLAGRLARNF